MPPRRQPHGSDGRARSGRGRHTRVAVGIALLALLAGCLAAGAHKVYGHRAEIRHFFSNPPPPDPALIDTAIEEAYARIAPTKVTTSYATLGGKEVRQDCLLLPKTSSLLRANAEITRAVENAGGGVAYGMESSDEKGRKTGVTLGVAIRAKLVREIRIEKSTKQ